MVVVSYLLSALGVLSAIEAAAPAVEGSSVLSKHDNVTTVIQQITNNALLVSTDLSNVNKQLVGGSNIDGINMGAILSDLKKLLEDIGKFPGPTTFIDDLAQIEPLVQYLIRAAVFLGNNFVVYLLEVGSEKYLPSSKNLVEGIDKALQSIESKLLTVVGKIGNGAADALTDVSTVINEVEHLL